MGALRYGAAGLETVVATPRTPWRAPRLRSLGSSLGPRSGDTFNRSLDSTKVRASSMRRRPIGLGHDRSDLIELARDRLGEGEGRLGIGLERKALGIAEIGGDGDPARRDPPAMKIEADGLYRIGPVSYTHLTLPTKRIV